MKLIARLVLVATLAAFAAASAAHAMGSATMGAGMIASAESAMDMPGCDDCGGPEGAANGLACDLVCGAGGLATLTGPQASGLTERPGGPVGPAEARDLRGRTGPPAEHPPRLLT